MTGLALALGLTALSAVVPAASPAVRLAPLRCGALSDGDIRTALKVELRERLLEETAKPPEDFVLISVSCESDHANLLAVRRGAGTPVRRMVALGGVAPEARPRATALAIAELLRVDAIRNTARPPPAVETAPLAPPATAFSVSASYAWLQTMDSHVDWYKGGAFRFAIEPGWNPAAVEWGWGAACQFSVAGPDNAVRLVGAGLAFVQRRGPNWVPQLGVGARVGGVRLTTPTPAPVETNLVWGPVASLATEYVVSGTGSAVRPGTGLAVIASVQGGFDFGYGGAWVGVYTGVGLRW